MMIKQSSMIGSVIILFLTSSVSVAQLQAPAQIPLKASNHAEQKSNITNRIAEHSQRGTEKMPLIVRTLPAPKDKEEAEHEVYERHEKPTNERWLTYSTIWLAFVTTFLAIFTAYLWDATRKLVKRAEETARQQLRAFIFGKGFNHAPHIWDGAIREYVLWVTWENVGLTPGIDVCSWVEVKTLPTNEEHQIIFAPSNERRPTVMGPRATTQTAFIAISLEKMMQKWRNETSIFVWSRVEYRDIFDSRIIHHHEQCASVELIHEPSAIPPEGHPPYVTFIAYGSQNSTG